ncbi:hypothetical protein [Roseibium alexandrii]|uniref:hypothetical protein n=1 Tax=Roseibium alexandrii TaxID=388408 RepID=UPI0037518ED3
MAYAEKTNVSVEKTKAEIERIVTRAGADSFMSFSERGGAKIAFELNGRRILFVLPLPDQSEKRFWQHSRGKRSESAAYAQWEQACRSKWRALYLTIKAKLESTEAGIESFDEAFLAHIMTPDGARFSERAVPAIEQAYQDHGAPVLRLEGPKGDR